MTKEICDGCIVDRDDIHRCRAIETSCQDGIACPDYLGEGNCGCPNPDCKEADMNLDKLVRYGKEVGELKAKLSEYAEAYDALEAAKQ